MMLPAEKSLAGPGYHTREDYQVTGKIGAPRGLGIVEEFAYLKEHTAKPMPVWWIRNPFTWRLLRMWPSEFASRSNTFRRKTLGESRLWLQPHSTLGGLTLAEIDG